MKACCARWYHVKVCTSVIKHRAWRTLSTYQALQPAYSANMKCARHYISLTMPNPFVNSEKPAEGRTAVIAQQYPKALKALRLLKIRIDKYVKHQ